MFKQVFKACPGQNVSISKMQKRLNVPKTRHLISCWNLLANIASDQPSLYVIVQQLMHASSKNSYPTWSHIWWKLHKHLLSRLLKQQTSADICYLPWRCSARPALQPSPLLACLGGHFCLQCGVQLCCRHYPTWPVKHSAGKKGTLGCLAWIVVLLQCPKTLQLCILYK